MIVLEDRSATGRIQRVRQSQVMYCPNDAAWEPIVQANQAALMAGASFEQFLSHLGMYSVHVKMK